MSEVYSELEEVFLSELKNPDLLSKAHMPKSFPGELKGVPKFLIPNQLLSSPDF